MLYLPHTYDENLIYDSLSSLKDLAEPAGAGSLRRSLEAKGYTIAEATAGRLLRDLDELGFTEKQSNQGRRLSENGEKRLRELKERKWQGQWTEDFMGTLEKCDKSRLVDLLAARCPVETEVVKLAAVNATEKEIEELRSVVEEQERLAQKGEKIAGLDTRFHRILAKASHNPILESLVVLLRKKQEYAQEFEFIRPMSGQLFNNEHRKILEAIEMRDQDMAVLSMKRHLESLMKMLEKSSDAESRE